MLKQIGYRATAGAFQNEDEMNSYSASIDHWLFDNIKNRGFERYEDLHIDQIDPAWKSREYWISGGLAAFREAVHLRDQHELDFAIVLAFSLKVDDETRGIDFRTAEGLEAMLDASPPSLYLFQKGKEPWTESGVREGTVVAENIRVSEVDPGIFGTPNVVSRCYYMEFRQVEFKELSRTLFLEG